MKIYSTASQAVICISLFLAGIEIASASENEGVKTEQNSAADLGFSAGQVQGVYPIKRLGGEDVAVWKDVKDKSRFFYAPAILPDWAELRSQTKEICGVDEFEGSLAIYQLSVPVFLNDKFYKNQILSALKSDPKLSQEVKSTLTIAPIPHDNIQIFLDPPGLESQLVLETKSGIRSEAFLKKSLKYTYPSAAYMNIVGDCSYLRAISKEASKTRSLLSGKLFASGVTYNQTYLTIEGKQSLAKRVETKIFGKENLVRTAEFDNSVDKTVPQKQSLISLLVKRSDKPTTASSGNARSSRQRLLSRDYARNVMRETVTELRGACTGTEAECAKLSARFLDWLLPKMTPITFEIVPDESEGARLISKNVTYATLDPAEYKTLIKSAPKLSDETEDTEASNNDTSSSSESDKDKNRNEEKKNNSSSTKKTNSVRENDITWEFSGSEPIPTNIDMHLIDDLKLDVFAGVEWYQNTPVSDSSGIYVVDLFYPVFAFATGKIETMEDLKKRQILSAQCKNGQLDLPLSSGNVLLARRGGNMGKQYRIYTDVDSSRRCRNKFGVTWTARNGHFFYFPEGAVVGKGLDVKFVHRKNRFGYDKGYPLIKERSGNVNIDGRIQAAQSVSVLGHGNGKSGTKSKSCGGIVQMKARQLPNACIPHVVKGYIGNQ